MPTPHEGEDKNTFISRCIPMLIDEGKNQDQAVAICNSLWSEKKKGESMSKDTFEDIKPNTSSGMVSAVAGNYEELPPLPDEMKPKTPEQLMDELLPVE